MARQIHFFLTNEDPLQLNAYSPEQLRRLVAARLIDADTPLTLYGSAVSRPLREWFNVRTWELRPEVALTNRKPVNQLRLFATVLAGVVGLELFILTILLGSLSAAFRWNGEFLASTSRKVGLFLHERARPKTDPANRAISYSGDLITLDAWCEPKGAQMAKLPVSAQLRITTAGEVGQRIFAAGSFSHGTDVISSVLLTSSDFGRTWSEAAPRFPATEFGAAQVSDLRVWIAAHRRLRGQPIDPFFLFTFDSGATWRRIPLRPYSESGRITRFHFREDGNGAAQVEDTDRKLFVTADGAHSWVLTEGEPPEFPGPKMPRVRVQESGNRLLIQRREAREWTTIAQFSAQAGTCPAP